MGQGVDEINGERGGIGEGGWIGQRAMSKRGGAGWGRMGSGRDAWGRRGDGGSPEGGGWDEAPGGEGRRDRGEWGGDDEWGEIDSPPCLTFSSSTPGGVAGVLQRCSSMPSAGVCVCVYVWLCKVCSM